MRSLVNPPPSLNLRPKVALVLDTYLTTRILNEKQILCVLQWQTQQSDEKSFKITESFPQILLRREMFTFTGRTAHRTYSYSSSGGEITKTGHCTMAMHQGHEKWLIDQTYDCVPRYIKFVNTDRSMMTQQQVVFV